MTLRTVSLIALSTAVLASGCATLTGKPTQFISVQTLDAQGQQIRGMRCRIINGSAEYVGDSPMMDMEIRRSATDLNIECRQGTLVARGTAISRSGAAALARAALMPGGSAGAVVDHVTGYGYSYPRVIQLRLGETMIVDASDDLPVRPQTASTER